MTKENRRRKLMIALSPISLFPIMMLLFAWQNQPCAPSNSLFPNASQSIPDASLHIPLNVVVASGENDKVTYDEAEIHRFVAYSNEVWSEAGISFEAKTIKFITVPDWRAKPLPTNADVCQFGRDFLGSEFEDEVIDIIYVKGFQLNLHGAGGITLNGGSIGAAFIEEFDDDYRANHTLSHELGHALNLVHVPGTENLMFDAMKNPGILQNRSTFLTTEQIGTAREYAYTYRCPELSCLMEQNQVVLNSSGN